jgi:hypothetical protein
MMIWVGLRLRGTIRGETEIGRRGWPGSIQEAKEMLASKIRNYLSLPK